MPASTDQLAEWAAAGAPLHGRLVVPTAPPAELPYVRGLLAGAAEVDLTPAPGMPKAGHSRNATDGAGFRTRLRARVVHLRAGRASVALVATDLHAGSALVHHLVAEAVAASTDVPLAGLFMGATHTHAGPGQIHGCDFYNRWASNRPGMDPAYVAEVVHRITAAVTEAVATRRPARAAVGDAEVWGVTRNRSLEAHVRNAGVADRRAGAHQRYQAVNPWLHLLRVDVDAADGGSQPLAALATFSIHGTGISRHDPSYNADIWAYLTGELTWRLGEATGFRPVVGAIEGTHGDMTPAVRHGLLAFPEAERIGRRIGAAAAALHASLARSLTSDFPIRAGLLEVDLDADPELGGVRLPPPAIGAAKLAGAAENATPLLDHIPPFSPGHPKWRGRGPQGAKWVVGGRRIHDRINPPGGFPRVMPVHAVGLGDTLLLGVPFEVTVEAGRRLQRAVAAAAPSAGRVVVSSVVDDYWDYLTTPEEYALQRYEGASTLYGPASLAFVTAAATDLARRLEGSALVQDAAPERTFAGLVHRYLPGAGGPLAGVRVTPAGDITFHDATVTEDAHWEVGWWGPGPGDLAWHQPLARVDRETPRGWVVATDPDGRPIDDQGWHVGVTAAGRRGARGRYITRWYGPPLGAPGRHRMIFDGVASAPFD